MDFDKVKQIYEELEKIDCKSFSLSIKLNDESSVSFYKEQKDKDKIIIGFQRRDEKWN